MSGAGEDGADDHIFHPTSTVRIEHFNVQLEPRGGYLIGAGDFGHFGLDEEVARLDVLHLLRKNVTEVVQHAQVLVGLVLELLSRHRDETQVGLVGDDIADELAGHIGVGLVNVIGDKETHNSLAIVHQQRLLILI